jgi:flagellar motor switch protein FliN/FliY
MIETPILEQAQGEERLIRTWARAAEQVLQRLMPARQQLQWARRQSRGSAENLATLEWWEAKFDAAGEHCVWIGMAGPAAVEVNRLAQVLASAGSQQPEAPSIPAQQTVESLCATFAQVLAAESGKAVEFQGLERLENAPAPDVLYSAEIALPAGPPAPILVGFRTAANAALGQLIEPAMHGRDSRPGHPSAENGALGLLLDLELPLSVRFGRVQMPLERVLELRPGSVVELEGSQDDHVDLLVNGSVVARGEVVAVEGQYAIRILEILSRDCKIGGVRLSSESQGA